ncbi:XdhC family protein [Neptunomonas sp.]|uniref:XdhC family protein n=1 Tax=Neptunomonas sp. TaxID=1971898 RepID=UPI0035643A81
MKNLDQQVIEQTLEWCYADETVWLCTVLATYGSSPRPPGAMLAAKADGNYIGSLSGGCVEEDFLTRLTKGELNLPKQIIKFGESDHDRQRLGLPCGGVLEVLVEQLTPNHENKTLFSNLVQGQKNQQTLIRCIELQGDNWHLTTAPNISSEIERTQQSIRIPIGPSRRLIIAGISTVANICAQFAKTLGFEVIVCDPREEVQADFNSTGIEFKPILPSMFIANGGCHEATAVVALTHDPRFDDLTMIEAVRTNAYYIGVMGSKKTSAVRAERLQRIGGLSRSEIERIRMPIGLNIGSRTPAEIALSVMADILKTQNLQRK